jgi:hypothetical protein
MQMTLARIVDYLRRRSMSAVAASAVPDPANEFPHTGNSELFANFKVNSKIASPEGASRWARGGYEIRAHPDLAPIL